MEQPKSNISPKTIGVIAAICCFVVLSVSYFFLIGRGYIMGDTADNKEIVLEDTDYLTDEDYECLEEEFAEDTILSTPGDYPQASERLLTEADVQLPKAELRKMRNEIFARYGYIFKSQDLKEWFGSKPWYSGRYSDVNHMLTDIERKNVEFIKKHE